MVLSDGSELIVVVEGIENSPSEGLTSISFFVNATSNVSQWPPRVYIEDCIALVVHMIIAS